MPGVISTLASMIILLNVKAPFEGKGSNLSLSSSHIDRWMLSKIESRMRLRSAVYLILVMTGLHNSSMAQNLVPNPSFEVYTNCPAFGSFGYALAPPWYSAEVQKWGHYYHECTTFFPYGVPNNAYGSQFARTGSAYTGAYTGDYDNFAFVRDFMQTPLTDTLQAGHCYKVGFYASLGELSCGVDHLGALLSPDPVMSPVGMTPQVDLGGVLLTDRVNWVFVFNYVLAVGNEAYITIGNFYSNAETTTEANCNNPNPDNISHYYVDDVIVEEVMVTDIDVSLDDQVTACDSFVIEAQTSPDVEDVLFLWSNGTKGSAITVTESGEYTVTAYYGCSSDEESIVVEIIHPPLIDLGDDVEMCAGETLTISLDPDLGAIEWQDGSSSSTYTIDATGQYIASIDNGCVVVADTINVLVVDPPSPVSLGDQLILCPGEVIQYDFDPLLGEFLWQDGSTASSFTIIEEGSYSLTLSNMCGDASDDVEVVEVTPPLFDIGPDTIRQCTGDIVDIELDHTMGSFHWQNGSNSNSYAITTGGMYSVTVTNPCGTYIDSLLAIYTAIPAVDLGADASLCQGDTLVLQGGNNSGTYAWQDGSAMTTFTATTSGTYALSITNLCGNDRDSVNLLFASPPATPDLGIDRNLCPGETIILSVNMPGNVITWSDGSAADTLLVSAPGTYNVQVMNACGISADTITITASAEPPDVQLPGDISICSGDTLTLMANVAGVSYLWNDGSPGSSLEVVAPGIYSVTVANNCGSDNDTIIISDGGAPPALTLGVDTAICAGTSITLLPLSSNVDTWLWQDGSVLPTYTTNVEGDVIVVGQNACGTVQDTIHIDLLPAVPPLSIGPDTSICDGETISLGIDIANVDIVWFNGSTDTAITITAPGIVHAMIANTCGESRDTMAVSLLPDPPVFTLGEDMTLCPGEIILFAPSISGVTYLWQDGSSNAIYQSTQAETVILTVANTCGTSTDTVVITESNTGPQVDLGPDVSVCEGETVLVESGLGGVDYLWQDGSVSSDFLASQSGTLILQVSNNCGVDVDTIEIFIGGNAPVVELGHDTLLCNGNTLVLQSSGTGSNMITWQDGSTSGTYMVTQPGEYFLQERNACGADADTIEVSFLDPPGPFTLGPDTLLCLGDTLMLHQPVTTDAFAWQDGSDGSSYLVVQPGFYSGHIINQCGQTSDTVHVSVIADTVTFEQDTLLYWCIGQHVELTAQQSFPATYVWSTGDNTPSITVTTPGMYEVDVYTQCGAASREFDIVPDPDCHIQSGIYIPNIFSPNGDQVNDVFKVELGSDITVKEMTGSIYDRWGDIVFSSSQIPFVWDGLFAGKTVMPGVYVFRLEIVYSIDGQETREVLSGDVTLIR